MNTVHRLIMAVVASALMCFAIGAGAAATEPPPPLDGAVILDVRTPEEFAEGHLEGAININYRDSNFAKNVVSLDHDAQYIVYCRSGNRSGKSIEIMQQQGFTQLYNAGGVTDASARLGLPIVK